MIRRPRCLPSGDLSTELTNGLTAISTDLSALSGASLACVEDLASVLGAAGGGRC